MKITATQHLTPINTYFYNNKKIHNKTNQNATNPQISYTNVHAYQDFGISFTGRTPENFYEQDFNRNNMPQSMKEYLDYDYETRQHIPPEQMMKEVFKYIDLADNFEDVKNVYPNEDLFKNLHENKSRNISSILYEIKTAKEMSNEPLFKDGNDNFGMYLLKKIYTEGKTIKEINKDFYTKDLNDEYKGIITKPITDKTTANYGIKFPKQAFWNSFIATRDEYRIFFVTLPKNTTNPAVHLPKSNKAEQTENKAPIERIRAPRKYSIPAYKKKQLTDDIKSSAMSNTDVEKKIRKRFAKDDPEASFIVKYLSPIMTVAAERAHLSEDLKFFAEAERINGHKGDEEFMLKRYWNRNPIMKNIYAHAITDTIDMFEDIYGAGGNLPINTDLEVVTPDTPNKKIVDHVNSEYAHLLDYTQTIFPEREVKYAEHYKNQEKWEKYFNEKYGDIKEEPIAEIKTPTPTPIEKEEETISPIEDKEFDEDSFSIDKVNEAFGERIKEGADYLPSPLLKEYCKFMSENADLAFKMQVVNLPKDCTVEDIQGIWRTDGAPDYIDDLNAQFFNSYEKGVMTTNCAIKELAITYNKPKFKNVRITTNSNEINGKDKEFQEFQEFISTHKQELNELYSKLLVPMTDRERNLTTLAFMNEIDKYQNNQNVNPRTNGVILMFKDISKLNKNQRKKVKDFINEVIPDSTKTILNKKLNEQEKFNQFIYFMDGLVDECVFNQQNLPFIVNKETVNKYTPLMNSFDVERIKRMESQLPPAGKEFYNAPNEKIKTGYYCKTIELPTLNK